MQPLHVVVTPEPTGLSAQGPCRRFGLKMPQAASQHMQQRAQGGWGLLVQDSRQRGSRLDWKEARGTHTRPSGGTECGFWGCERGHRAESAVGKGPGPR